MNEAWKDKWVAALRSGKYTQTTGKLCREQAYPGNKEREAIPAGFCCLGVLTDIVCADPETGFDWRPESPEDIVGMPDNDYALLTFRGSGTLNKELASYVGLGLTDPVVPESHSGDSLSVEPELKLSYANDNLNLDFNQIADLIERHWRDL